MEPDCFFVLISIQRIVNQCFPPIHHPDQNTWMYDRFIPGPVCIAQMQPIPLFQKPEARKNLAHMGLRGQYFNSNFFHNAFSHKYNLLFEIDTHFLSYLPLKNLALARSHKNRK